MMSITIDRTQAMIAPLLRVRTRPEKTAAATIAGKMMCQGSVGTSFRFFILSRMIVKAAKKARIKNEPAELEVVKKPRMSFEKR